MLGKHGSSVRDKDMLKNFDILAYHKYSQSQLERAPTLDGAKKLLEPSFVRDDQNHEFSLCCDIDEFKKYGPGVYLSFRFLKYLLVVMGVLLPFPLVNMIVLITQDEHINGANVELMLETTTLANLKQNEEMVIGFNFLVLFVLTCSIFYWRYLQTQFVLSCTRTNCLSSYFTVLLTKIPNYYTEKDLLQYLEDNYGKVHEIQTVKNYQERDFELYQELNDIVKMYRQERELYLRSKAVVNCLGLVQLFKRYIQKHEEIVSTIVQSKDYEPVMAFVTFKNAMIRNILLTDQQVKLKNCCRKDSVEERVQQQLLYKDQKLQFQACKMQPDGIIWQNINISKKEKIIRCGMILCLLSTFLFVSIIIFFILAAAEASLYLDQISDLTESQVIKSQNVTIIQSFCMQLSYNQFKNHPMCQQFDHQYINYFILYLLFPFFVTFLKEAFATLMKKLVVIRRHKYKFYQIQWEVVILTIFFFIKAGLIKWFIYRSFKIGNTEIALLQYFQPILNQMAKILPISPQNIYTYHQFSNEWVGHTSHKVILIGMLSFNFSIIFKHFSGIISKRWGESSAQKQLTQQRMAAKMKGHQFQFQFIYAEMLALFLFCMLYFSCMPLIYIFVYISLFLLYWVLKYNLIRLASKPPIYGHSINELAMKIVVIGLAINSLVSPLYFGNRQEKNDSNWLDRWCEYWYYSVNFVMLILFLTCRLQLIKIFYFIRKCFFSCIGERRFSHRYLSRMNTMNPVGEFQSYSMHSNEHYSSIVKALFALNRNEVERIGYYQHKGVEEVKIGLKEYENECFLFDQLYHCFMEQMERGNRVKQDIPGLSKSDYEKYVQYKPFLQRIRSEIRNEVEEEQKFNSMAKAVKSVIVELNKMNKSFNGMSPSMLKAPVSNVVENLQYHQSVPNTGGRLKHVSF